ncbi:hypothetical protein [Psychrobacter urativorans]|uniref:Uncharacterized protein n=1 Tax=Psychrobacter urativorans TaxID=45610 RepID=A0A0M3V8S1_9GAMM|nr:hypothetical protein [Psychrobacter urativorans]ALF59673.1 hypothetical protein AOC03_06195 [Psychrobacter urativorans]
MQLKHLIIFALVAMALLLGFNVINGNRHENNRAATENTETIADTTNTIASTAADSDDGNNNITSKPLGEQPKAIMDKATTQIDSAQQADNARLAQMDSAQQ